MLEPTVEHAHCLFDGRQDGLHEQRNPGLVRSEGGESDHGKGIAKRVGNEARVVAVALLYEHWHWAVVGLAMCILPMSRVIEANAGVLVEQFAKPDTTGGGPGLRSRIALF